MQECYLVLNYLLIKWVMTKLIMKWCKNYFMRTSEMKDYINYLLLTQKVIKSRWNRFHQLKVEVRSINYKLDAYREFPILPSVINEVKELAQLNHQWDDIRLKYRTILEKNYRPFAEGRDRWYFHQKSTYYILIFQIFLTK